MMVQTRFGPQRVSRHRLVAGDPGIFSFLPGLIKGIGKVGKFIAGGVGAVSGKPAGTAVQLVPTPAIPALPGAGPSIIGGLPTMIDQAGIPHQVGQAIGRAIGRAPAGFRNGIPLFPGGVSKGRRRMNVLNPRALRRALRRAQGFERFARKTVTLTKRMKFKKRRRR